MSDLLRLASQLRSSSDAALAQLVMRRRTASAAQDFLDLAQALLQPKSIEAALARLNSAEVKSLRDLLSGVKVKQDELTDLISLGLADANGSVFEPVLKVAKDLIVKRSDDSSAEPHWHDPLPASNNSDLSPLASIAAFETIQAITELLLDLEQHRVRVVGKSGVGLPDVKRLANHLRKPQEDARLCYELAIALQLLASHLDSWQLTPLSQEWITSSVSNRWVLATRYWLVSLGEKSQFQLGKLLQGESPINLRTTLAQMYPLADKSVGGHMVSLAAQAEALGLSVHSQASPLLKLVLNGDWANAVDELEVNLPATQESIIVQADLSLITPGPLPTKTELLLRTFAQVEQVSVASMYRLSALSLSHGLECGLTAEEITKTLVDLSKKPLPQPVEYLIAEAKTRFGRLTLVEAIGAEAKCLVKSPDGLLLTEILNDVRLKPFALYPFSAGALASRFDSNVLYFGLRELGYVPIRIDQDGQVISPRTALEIAPDAPKLDLEKGIVKRLRDADERIGSEPDDSDLLRQIQLAVKNKSPLHVTLTARDGTEVSFEVLPTSLANGRLRGLDRKADIERTLPLDRIIRVGF